MFRSLPWYREDGELRSEFLYLAVNLTVIVCWNGRLCLSATWLSVV